jgi:nucleotide-binding universal stress UspA family protein
VSDDARQTFHRILVGVDGSARAEEAARQAARLASTAGAELVFAYVIDTGHPHDAGDVEAEAEAALERAAALARSSPDAKPDARLLAGSPATALLDESKEFGADLICVGQDAGVLGGAIRVGRVAEHVMREAGCSVLIARTAGSAFPERVVCGVDGSEFSAQTAALAGAIAASSGAELRLVHVVPVFRGRDAEWTLDEDEPSPPELEASVAAATARGIVPRRDVAMGRPEHALVAAVERAGGDLLVVGHRGVRGVSRVVLGSVSEHCAKHAPCSVLVARRSGD